MFARAVAENLFSAAPVAVLQQRDDEDKASASKADRIYQSALDDATLKIAQFKAANKLGVYGKAKLHLEFLERLKELGYPEVLARKINQRIMFKTPR